MEHFIVRIIRFSYETKVCHTKVCHERHVVLPRSVFKRRQCHKLWVFIPMLPRVGTQ